MKAVVQPGDSPQGRGFFLSWLQHPRMSSTGGVAASSGSALIAGVTDHAWVPRGHRPQSSGLQAAGSEAAGPEELRVLLVGKRGAGKSTAGNRLLRRRAFEARFSNQRVTRWCESEHWVWEDRDVLVIDAPDIAARRDLRDIRAQLLRLSFPGPHALLLVTPLGSFSQRDEAVLATLRRWFGDTFPEFLFVLFTREEDLGGQDPAAFLESGGAALHPVVEQCRDRWVFPDDKAVGATAEPQDNQLLRRIAAVVELNEHRPCTFTGTGKPLPRPLHPMSPGWEDALLSPREPQLRLILVGRTGTGTSATGNSILGRPEFESKLGAVSVTRACSVGMRRWGRWLVEVMDTPDLFGTDVALTDPRWRELGRCHLLSAPGPHALLLVCQLRRFRVQDQEAWRQVKAMFGRGVAARTVVVFTGKEDLTSSSLLEYARGADPHALQELVDECGHQVCGFDNCAASHEREEQAQKLLVLLEGLVVAHGGAPYSNSVYRRVQDLCHAYPDDRLHRVAQHVADGMQSPELPWPSACCCVWRLFFWAWCLSLVVLLGVLSMLLWKLCRQIEAFGQLQEAGTTPKPSQFQTTQDLNARS